MHGNFVASRDTYSHAECLVGCLQYYTARPVYFYSVPASIALPCLRDTNDVATTRYNWRPAKSLCERCARCSGARNI